MAWAGWRSSIQELPAGLVQDGVNTGRNGCGTFEHKTSGRRQASTILRKTKFDVQPVDPTSDRDGARHGHRRYRDPATATARTEKSANSKHTSKRMPSARSRVATIIVDPVLASRVRNVCSTLRACASERSRVGSSTI